MAFGSILFSAGGKKSVQYIYSLQTVIDFSALYSLLPYSVAIVLMSYSIAYSEPI